MQTTRLAGTDLVLSRLSFGTSRLHHVVSAKGRSDLLAAAADHGFTHFDTAPIYGFGLAEEELGRLVAGRRARLTITTKIGLYAPSGATGSTLDVLGRKLVRRLVPRYGSPIVDWSLTRATASLEASLRRLRTDYVDLLLLHEPVSELIDSDAMLGWLNSLRAAGRIRAWGVAGDADRMGAVLMRSGLGPILQLRDSIEQREAASARSLGADPHIAFGYLAGFSRRPRQADVATVLDRALRLNPAGSVLVSSTRMTRVAELAAIASASTADSVLSH